MFNFAQCELCEKKTKLDKVLVRNYDLSKMLRFTEIKSPNNFSEQPSRLTK